MLHLKLAEHKDAIVVAVLFNELFNTSVYSTSMEYNFSDVKKLTEDIVAGDPNNGSVILLVNEGVTVGALMCSSVHHLFNRSEKSAVEIGFWIRPEFRSLKAMKLLLGAYKYWAKTTGCSTIMYGKMKSNSKPEEYIIRKLT